MKQIHVEELLEEALREPATPLTREDWAKILAEVSDVVKQASGIGCDKNTGLLDA